MKAAAEDRFYAIHSQFCMIFSCPLRIKLFHALEHGERTVGDLAETSGATMANVSQHLRLMRDKGAVLSRNAATVYYRIANPKFMEAAPDPRGLIEKSKKRRAPCRNPAACLDRPPRLRSRPASPRMNHPPRRK
jgi:ArsR family transcriptional regulator